MQRIVLAAVWACVGREVVASLTVGVGAPQCSHRDFTLSCDYHNSQQVIDMEEVGDLVDGRVDRVLVRNGQTLRINGRLCVSVILDNIADVVVEEHLEYECQAFLDLSARNSSLNKLPSHMSKVYLEDSAVVSLTASSNMTELQVVHSTINLLDMSQSCLTGFNATFVSSTINSLQRLDIGSGSNLLFDRVQILNIPAEGLVMSGGSVVMQETTTRTTATGSVVLGPGASLSLENNTGTLTLKTTLPTTFTNEHVTEMPSGCVNISSYYVAFATCLTLLVVLSVFFTSTIFYLLRKTFSEEAHYLEMSPITEPGVISDLTKSRHSFPHEAEELLPPNMHGLEELTESICSTMQKQKSLEEDKFRALEQKYKAKLADIENVKARTLQTEEIFINNELQDLDVKYKKEEKITGRSNCDAKLDLLKQIRDIKETKEKLYNGKTLIEKQELEQKKMLEEAMQSYVKQLYGAGRAALRRWEESQVPVGESWPHLATIDDLLKHIIAVLHKELNTKLQDSKSHGELLRYVSNEEIQRLKKKYAEKLRELDTFYEKEHLQLGDQQQSSQAAEGSSKKLKVISASKSELLAASQRLEMKMLLNEYSEDRLKIQYLDSMVLYLDKSITDMINILSFTALVLRFNVKLLSRALRSSSEKRCDGGETQLKWDEKLPDGVK